MTGSFCCTAETARTKMEKIKILKIHIFQYLNQYKYSPLIYY